MGGSGGGVCEWIEGLGDGTTGWLEGAMGEVAVEIMRGVVVVVGDGEDERVAV